MRELFLTCLAVFLGMAFVRFCYGLGANSSSYVVQVILDLPPDVKEDFSQFQEALDNFLRALSAFKNISSANGVLGFLSALRNFIYSLFEIPIAFIQCVLFVLRDLASSLASVFELLFSPASVPIKP